MDAKEKLELIKRNAVEVIEEKELVELLKKKKRPVVYCGYEVSGEVHLGHLVTITKLVDFEKAGFHVKVLFADWHTWLNQKGDWDFIHRQAKNWEKAFKTVGLKNAEYVLGTKFQRDVDYIDHILKLALKITMNRALRSMQEIARDIEHARVSQLIYPLMQAYDITALKVDVAYAGLEQRKIHMLAREYLPEIGGKAPICVHTPLIPSLKGPGSKMSSSDPASLLSVRDSEGDIRKKIKDAYCPEGDVKDNPVLLIARLLIFPRIEKFEVKRPEKFGGNVSFACYEELEKAFAEKKLHPMDLKNAVSEYMVKILEPVRKAFK